MGQRPDQEIRSRSRLLVLLPAVLVLAFAFALLLLPKPLASSIAPEGRVGRVTGLPIPRFVSLGTTRAHMRVGPGTKYRIEWVYRLRGLPLEVLAEYSNWRKVRDAQGTAGWIFHSLLSGRRTALAAPWGHASIPLLAEGGPDASVLARLAPRVLLRVPSCDGTWCRVQLIGRDLSGYVSQGRLWGVYPGESFG